MQKTQNDLKQKIKIDTNQESSNYEYLLNARKSALNTKAKNKKFHWLTNHSRSFLAAGYIAEVVLGQTLLMIWEIFYILSLK